MVAEPTADIEKWIEWLPNMAYFTLAELPCEREEAEAVIAEMLIADLPAIRKTPIPELYYRDLPPICNDYGKPSWDFIAMAQKIMPPGSGLAGGTALWVAGWSTQMPFRYRFTTSNDEYELPTFPRPGISAVEVASNPRRLDLSWHEVSLLEAILNFPISGCRNLKIAKTMLLRHFAERAGRNALIRTKKIVWAAETEDITRQAVWELPKRSKVAFPAMVKQVAKWLPKVTTTSWDGRLDWRVH